MESRNVAAMIHRHATFRIQPVRTKRNHPSTCHPDRVKRAEGSTQVASFPCGGSFTNVVDSSTPLTLRSEWQTFLHWLLQIQMYNVYGGRLPPLHCVVPFNRTGCNCNVAGMVAAPTGVCRAGARLSLSILPKKECRKLVKNTWQTRTAVVTYASCLMNGLQMARRAAKHWKIAWKKLKKGLTSY